MSSQTILGGLKEKWSLKEKQINELDLNGVNASQISRQQISNKSCKSLQELLQIQSELIKKDQNFNENKQKIKAQNIDKDYGIWLKGKKLEAPKAQIISNNNQSINLFFSIQSFTKKCLQITEKKETQIQQQAPQEEDLDQINKQTLLHENYFEEFEYKHKANKKLLFIDNQVFNYSYWKSCLRFFLKEKLKMQKRNELIEQKVIRPYGLYNSAFGFALSQYCDLFYQDLKKEKQKVFLKSLFNHIKKHLDFFDKIKKKKNKIPNLQKINGFNCLWVILIANFNHEIAELLKVFLKLINEKETELIEKIQNKIQEFDSEENGMQKDAEIGFGFSRNQFYLQAQDLKQSIQFITLEKLGQKKQLINTLSSVEILYLHNIHNFALDDLNFLLSTLKLFNRIPKHESVLNDFSSIKDSFIQNKSKFFRQTIAYGQVFTLELNAVLNQTCFNYKGNLANKNFFGNIFNEYQIKNNKFINSVVGALKTSSIQNSLEEKLNFLQNSLWKKFWQGEEWEQCIIYTRTVFEFTKLKKALSDLNAPCVFISENTAPNKAQSIFARFNNKQYKFICIAERAVYFQVSIPDRFKRIIFFSLPSTPELFNTLLNNLQANQDTSQDYQVFFFVSQLDLNQAEILFGTKNIQEFINSFKNNLYSEIFP